MNEDVISPSEEDIDARESRRSRWFFIVFFAALFLSIAMTFYRTFVARNYDVIIETVCDPYVSVCFARDICETEDGVCGEGDVPLKTEYYKLVERKAFAFPEVCATGSLEAEECADLSCRPDEADCTETFCMDETAPEGESCLGPGVVIEVDAAEDASLEEGVSAEGDADAGVPEDATLSVEDDTSENAPDEEEQGMEGEEENEGKEEMTEDVIL